MDPHSNGHPEPPTDKYPPDPPTTCRYCQSPVELRGASEVFNNPSFDGKLYMCSACGARVGVHDGTEKPLGYLADDELRRWRRVLHEAMDPLWRGTRLSRTEVYEMIEEVLDVPEERAHVGMLSISEVKKMVFWLMRDGPALS